MSFTTLVRGALQLKVATVIRVRVVSYVPLWKLLPTRSVSVTRVVCEANISFFYKTTSKIT